jgi:hypothetical protein
MVLVHVRNDEILYLGKINIEVKRVRVTVCAEINKQFVIDYRLRTGADMPTFFHPRLFTYGTITKYRWYPFACARAQIP